MDIEKEREAFEAWLFSTEKFKFRNKNFLFMLDEFGSYEDKPVLEHWETWQASKAQAVPGGFVVLAIDDMERICRCLDDHAVYITYKASDALESIQKAMTEAQEQK